jgi:hypothetical protein
MRAKFYHTPFDKYMKHYFLEDVEGIKLARYYFPDMTTTQVKDMIIREHYWWLFTLLAPLVLFCVVIGAFTVVYLFS